MLFASKTPQGFISLSIWLDLTVFSLSYLNQKLIPIRQKTFGQNGECQFSNKVLESGRGFSKRQSTIIAGGSQTALHDDFSQGMVSESFGLSAHHNIFVLLGHTQNLQGLFLALDLEITLGTIFGAGMKPKLAVQGQCSSWYTITLLPSTEVWHACWELWCS